MKIEIKTLEEIRDILLNVHEAWELVDTIYGEATRWHRNITVITKHIPTGKVYMGCYMEAATEYQEDDFPDWELVEAKAIEKVVYEWVPIDENTKDMEDTKNEEV